MATIHLNIGSNLGHRQVLIGQAVAGLHSAFGGEMRVSAPVETPPWGFSSPHPFLNVGVVLTTDAPVHPMSVLSVCQKVERDISPASHRTPDGGYADRLIDIDIIAIDEIVVDTAALTLPHPRMHLREFVLRPMAELAPGWRHPLLGLTPEEMMRSLVSAASVDQTDSEHQ